MIVERVSRTEDCGKISCRIWLDEPLSKGFVERLLNELLAFATPVGLGVLENFARRHEDQSSLITEAVEAAAYTSSGKRRLRDHYWFDYVAGNRIKVSYWPIGVLSVDEEDPDETSPHPYLPFVSSAEFEDMYGHGSLEGAVRIALQG